MTVSRIIVAGVTIWAYEPWAGRRETGQNHYFLDKS